jgi:hypothetical protein
LGQTGKYRSVEETATSTNGTAYVSLDPVAAQSSGILKSMAQINPAIINAAIEGFEAQKRRIDDQIAELRSMLPGAPATANETARPKRKISAAARRRMALGQQKRWAAIKGGAASVAPEASKPKRELSAEGRAAIVAALKKRWAAKKKAAAAEAKPAAKKAAVKKSGNKSAKAAAGATA